MIVNSASLIRSDDMLHSPTTTVIDSITVVNVVSHHARDIRRTFAQRVLMRLKQKKKGQNPMWIPALSF
jgi:hypothetical protein